MLKSSSSSSSRKQRLARIHRTARHCSSSLFTNYFCLPVVKKESFKNSSALLPLLRGSAESRPAEPRLEVSPDPEPCVLSAQPPARLSLYLPSHFTQQASSITYRAAGDDVIACSQGPPFPHSTFLPGSYAKENCRSCLRRVSNLSGLMWQNIDSRESQVN